MAIPLDNIKDGYEFQRIVAEYFRCLKDEQHEYHIADIDVDDNGVGSDDGCDILVEFHFEDAIKRHSHRWVIECKSQKKAVGNKDINTNNIYGILKSNNAQGYLLVCKTDATSTLKRWFKEMNNNENVDFIIWNGSQLWRKFVKRESLLMAFFPEYYKEKFIDTNDKENFELLYKKFEKKIKK